MSGVEQILPKLIEATDNGKLRWQDTVWDNRFKVNLAGKTVFSYMWQDPDTGNAGFGAIVGDISGSAVYDEVSADKYSAYYETLFHLYRLARRSATGGDDVVNEIDQALDKLLS